MIRDERTPLVDRQFHPLLSLLVNHAKPRPPYVYITARRLLDAVDPPITIAVRGKHVTVTLQLHTHCFALDSSIDVRHAVQHDEAFR